MSIDDLSPYAGRWVALINDRVAGVGHTPAEAEQVAQRNRPKDRFAIRYVEPDEGEVLVHLSPLLARLRPLLAKQPQPVYLVGGAVRDALLGRTSHDLDFTVPQGAIRLAFTVADWLGVPAYVLDRERDTGRVVLAETTLDFARFRGDTLADDLRDRDFTANAIALPATAERITSLIDPCDGRADIQTHRLRITHDDAIRRDPVRALRAVRLATELAFTLSPETKTAVRAAVPHLPTVSAERIRDELLKLLLTDAPHEALARLTALDLLPVVLPEMVPLIGLTQPEPHHEPVWAHTLSVLRWLPVVETAVLAETPPVSPAGQNVQQALADFRQPLQAHLAAEVDGGFNGRLLLRLGALFHDVGKADTRTVDENGRVRFLGHDQVGAKLTATRLRRLCLSNKAIAHVQRTVANHMRPLLLANSQQGTPSRRAVYRFFRASGASGVDVCLLALADHLATYDGAGPLDVWQRLLTLIGTLLHHYFNHRDETVSPPPLVNGRELMAALNLPPGPEIGRLLRLIEEAQATGEVETAVEAINFARRSRH